MKNLIEYDEQVIGYKDDLIHYLQNEIRRLKDYDFKDYEDLKEEIDTMKNYFDLIDKLKGQQDRQLYGIHLGVMGDLTITRIYIEEEY